MVTIVKNRDIRYNGTYALPGFHLLHPYRPTGRRHGAIAAQAGCVAADIRGLITKPARPWRVWPFQAFILVPARAPRHQG